MWNVIDRLICLDANLSDRDVLQQGAIEHSQVVELTADRDGFSQITAALATVCNRQHAQLQSLHLVSHGAPGCLLISGSTIDTAALEQYRSVFANWRPYFTDDAVVYLYGCEVGAGRIGRSFVTRLSHLLGLPVAASETLTGHVERGGDWELAVCTGQIPVQLAFTPETQQRYSGLLNNDLGFQFGNLNTATTNGWLWNNGTAAQLGDILQLTPDQTFQRASSFVVVPMEVSPNTSFSTNFQFRLSGAAGTNGSDGFTLTLHNAAAGVRSLGADGGNMGYGGIDTSLAIKFDTYQNPGIDISNNTVSIVRDGTVLSSLATTNAPIDLNDGQIHTAWIDYNGVTDQLDVYIGNGAKPGQALLSTIVDLVAIVGSQAYVGFTAGTGAIQQQQEIFNWGFQSAFSSGLGTGAPPPAVPTVNLDLATVSPDQINLNGMASRVGSAIQLIPDQIMSRGSAFYTTPVQISETTGFSTEFEFTLDAGAGTNGADGITFTLQNADVGAAAIGAVGSYLGAGLIERSLSIKFDTYQSPGDISDNSVGIFRDGNALNLINQQVAPFDLNDGRTYKAWIDYDGLSNVLALYLADGPVKPATPILIQAIDLPAIVGDQAYVGFTSSAGAIANRHTIQSWQFAADIPPVNTFTLKDNATTFVNEAAGVATITAVRTGSISSRATLEYTTNEVGAGSATADADYSTPSFNGRANTGQIVFEAGEAEKSFTVPIVNDTLVEGNETFAIGIQNPTGGTLGAPRTVLITIVDDDSPATISLSAAAVSVSEGVGTVNLTVQRSGNIASAATVNYATNNGTAIAGSDYAASTGTITFAAGQTSQTIAIPIIDDAAVENSETFSVTLSNPTGGASLGGQTTSTITILDNDLALGNLTRQTAVSGLNQPIAIDWTPDGQYMLVAQKNGVVRVVDNGTLRSTPLIDLSSQVNDTRDRGLIGMAIHPNFPATPYIYLSYTYDPPEADQNRNPNTDLDDPDGSGNRPARVVRVTVNPATMIADPSSLVVLLGKNSTWQYTSQPDSNSTGSTGIPPSGIVNGTTITAPANQIDVGIQDNDPDRAGIQNQNIRDYLATDSESHTIGAVHFGADGYLYVSNGDGTSYNFADPRSVRVQDVDNLSGKVLRIDPITGEGIASNPFYDGDPNSNQSKVFYSGLRNPFRFTFDPVTGLPVIGDVGWNSWEEINTGAAGSNFGWPYIEGPNRTGGYQDLSQAISFYNNGNINPGSPSNQAAVFPILERSHGAPDNATAIVVGDFYNANTLMFGDLNNGTLYAATLDVNRNVTSVQVFDSGIAYVVDMEMGPDGKLYGVNLVSGQILRWDPA